MTLGESPLLLSARAAVAELWSTERTEESGADGREETVTEPVEETPLETTGETDNGVPARTLVPTDPSGYTVCGRSYISNSTDHALTVTELSEPFTRRVTASPVWPGVFQIFFNWMVSSPLLTLTRFMLVPLTRS